MCRVLVLLMGVVVVLMVPIVSNTPLDNAHQPGHFLVMTNNKKFNAGMPFWLHWDGARRVVVRHPRFEGKY